jgi:exosome complex component RRP40
VNPNLHFFVQRSSFCRLYNPEFFLLKMIGERFPMEVVVGMNGRVWIRTTEAKHTIAVARCIEAVDDSALTEDKTKKLLSSLDL